MSVLKREINNMSILKVGCLQLNLQKTDNLDYVVHAIKNFYNDNSSIDLIVISELAVGGAGAKNTNHSLEIHLDTFSNLAKELGVWLIPGTFYESCNNQIFNTAPVFDTSGNLITKARKLYPWLPYEKDVDEGNDICVFTIPNKGTIGIHICYDLWFPETSRALALGGAELIINPTLTPTKDREIETLMVRTTAAQQQCFYIDVNSCGDQGCGLSIASNPDGDIMHLSSHDEEMFIVDIDFNHSNRSRIQGFMGLGQNLKSYRDKPFNILNNIDANTNYLDTLGELKDFKKE